MSGRLLAIAACLAAAVFSLFPEIDLRVSAWFYRPGAGFFLAEWGPVRVLYHVVPLVTYAVIVFALLAILVHALGHRRLLGCDTRIAAYLVLALAIGPGLIANTVLKDHWGRARPSQVAELGGKSQFTPALVPTNQCQRNCSFVAGHAAMGYYLITFAFLVPARRARRIAEAAALAAGSLIGFARIAQGGHFLSDVVFAGIVVYATSWWLHSLIVVRGFPSTERLQRLAAAMQGPPLRRLLAGTALTAVAVTLSCLLIDRPVARFFHAQSPLLLDVFRFITNFGLSKWYLIGAAGLFAGLQLAARAGAFAAVAEQLEAYSYLPLYGFVMLATPGLAADLVKCLFGRLRPKLLFADDRYGFTGLAFHADRWSFPSGHTVNAVAIAIALCTIWPRLLPLGIVFATLIALSRIIITAHYVGDVLGGVYVAVVVTYYVDAVFRRSGIDIAAAKAGVLHPLPQRSWRQRLGLEALP